MLIDMAERGWVPDPGIRVGIRHLIAQRLRKDTSQQDYAHHLASLRKSDIAIETDAANEQHYEVPAQFYHQVLGAHLKYSSAYWPEGVATLDSAEAAMLMLYAQRAELCDGQRVLDLGCGWGSFTLWAAQRYPNSQFTAVSNSHSQREHIEAEALKRGLNNVQVITADINQLSLDTGFDRVVTVEMLEHVRNYQAVFANIARWLQPDGKLFVHIFCNRSLLYPYEDRSNGDWMARHFFTGGLMPAADTLLHFQDDLRLEERWHLSGEHYQRTARAWLDNLDASRDSVAALFDDTYGSEPERWVQRWRMFFMACEELFGYDSGREWLVCHYRFAKR